MTDEKPIAEVIHWFDKISVAILRIADGKKLKVGDKVKFVAGETEFEQEVSEIQVDLKPIPEATSGMEVGVKTIQKAREGAKVFLV